MRIAFLPLMAAISCMAHAGPSDCSNYPVLTTTKEDGTTIGIVISDELRKRTPQWNIESGDPPLPLSKAVAAAKAWAKKTYTRYDDVKVECVTLNSYGCAIAKNQWYYLVHFSPIIEGNALFGGTYFAAVLMDGTVVGPVPIKR